MSKMNTIKAALVDIEVLRGDDTEVNVILTDPNDFDYPVDLTVYGFLKLQVRENKDDKRFIFETNATGEVDGNLGFVVRALHPIKKGKTYWYDVEGYNSAEDTIRTVMEGKLQVNKDVTR